MRTEKEVRDKFRELMALEELDPRIKPDIEPLLNILRWVIQGEGNISD
jgi:hypothetical protein